MRSAGNEDGGKPGRSYSLYDQASNLLTNVLNPGGSGNMPVAEGAVSDLFGRPLFFALYDWFMEVGSGQPRTGRGIELWLSQAGLAPSQLDSNLTL